MSQIVEAVYKNGVIEPLEKLDLPESQRLRITVETMEEDTERQAREQYERAVAILERRGTRRYTREELEAVFGPIHPVDPEEADRVFAKLGGKLSEEIIREREESW
jgi:predicted DNA-binding antitoxin AbrB/MazE fold protein